MEKINDKSVGVMPIFKTGGEIKVLLVRHAKGHWGFPKGHPESGESELETAARELAEETSLHKLELVPGVRLEEVYDFEKEGKIYHKTVIYFLALVQGEPQVPPEFAQEIVGLEVLTPELALAQITYPEGREILRAGLELLKSYENY